jgi:hypothetical protein
VNKEKKVGEEKGAFACFSFQDTKRRGELSNRTIF